MSHTLNIQDVVSKAVFMVSVFLIATAARGEWLLFIVYLGKDFLQNLVPPATPVYNASLPVAGTLDRLGLHDLPYYMAAAIGISFVTFWGIGFTFDTYFYKNRKHVPETWKCQPDRWLTSSNEWHEFILGSTNMLIGSAASGVISCYIMNGGYTSLYTNINDRGWLYLALSIPALFMYNEAVSYYPHRLFHYPWLYRRIHKLHHRYGSPTIYSTVAMHPLEFLMYQTFLALPAFFVPLHPAVFVSVLLYGYYYGMMDHSGIKMSAMWPWQPSSMFHDDHHRHFHCNFGFNTLLFDRFHDTLRKKNYKYGEKVFGGHGKTAKTETTESSEYYNYK